MALYHETDLKLTCESGSQRGCSMWVTVRWGRGCGRKVVPAHVDNGACNTTVSVVSWGCKWMFQVCVCLLLWSLTSPGSTGWGFLLMHCVCVCVCVCVFSCTHSVMSYSLWPHGLYPSRLPCPWNFPGKNTGSYCHFPLQGVFPTEESVSLMSPALASRFFTSWAIREAPQSEDNFTSCSFI